MDDGNATNVIVGVGGIEARDAAYLRDLFYVSRLLQKITRDANLYSSTLVKIPTPRFVVFPI